METSNNRNVVNYLLFVVISAKAKSLFMIWLLRKINDNITIHVEQ